MTTDQPKWMAIRAKQFDRLVLVPHTDAFQAGAQIVCDLDGEVVEGIVIATGVTLPAGADMLVGVNPRPAQSPVSKLDPDVSGGHQRYLDSWRSSLHPGTRIRFENREGTILQVPYKSGNLTIRFDDGTEDLISDELVGEITLAGDSEKETD